MMRTYEVTLQRQSVQYTTVQVHETSEEAALRTAKSIIAPIIDETRWQNIDHCDPTPVSIRELDTEHEDNIL